MAETSNVLLISGKILTQDIYLKRHQQSIKRNKKRRENSVITFLKHEETSGENLIFEESAVRRRTFSK